MMRPCRDRSCRVHEQARENHGARHRDHDADDRPLQQGPAHEGGRPIPGRRRARCRAGRPGTPPLDAQQISQRELHADREHEEDDADLGEELEGVQVGDGRTRREGADQDAAEDVPEDKGLPGRPRGRWRRGLRRARRRRDPEKPSRRRPWRADLIAWRRDGPLGRRAGGARARTARERYRAGKAEILLARPLRTRKGRAGRPPRQFCPVM